MESLDWMKLSTNITPNTNKVLYEPNKHLFRKVAFDVFQMDSSPVESLWSLEKDDDGIQYLVALYSDEQSDNIEVKSDWEAISDKKAENITLAYKNMPIQRFAAKEYGFTPEDAPVFQKSLVDLLNSDKAQVAKLLRSQGKERLGIIAQHFPELQVYAEDPMMQSDPYENTAGEDFYVPEPSTGEEDDEEDDTENFINPYGQYGEEFANQERNTIEEMTLPMLQDLMSDSMVDERFPKVNERAKAAYSAMKELLDALDHPEQ